MLRVRVPSLSPFFLQKNGERSRKASLHCAVRHNFTQKTKFFLHIFTKFQKPCLWSRSISFRLWRGQLALPVKFSRCASKDGVTFILRYAYTVAAALIFIFASSTVCDKNSYLFCAWNFRQLYRFLLVTFAKQMLQLISQNGQWRTETDDNGHGFQKNCPYLSVLSPFKSVRSPRVIHQIH